MASHRWFRSIWIAVAIVVIVVSGSAQARPDFSGRWVIPEEATRGRGGDRTALGSGWGNDITITQDTRKLTVEYAFFSRGDMQAPLKFSYALDGTESRNRVMMGRGMEDRVSKTVMDGNKLVITTVFAVPDPVTGKATTTEMKQSLSLESPTSLVIETTRNGILGGASTTTKSTYTKR